MADRCSRLWKDVRAVVSFCETCNFIETLWEGSKHIVCVVMGTDESFINYVGYAISEPDRKQLSTQLNFIACAHFDSINGPCTFCAE